MSNITLEFVEDIQLTLPIVRAIRGDTGPIGLIGPIGPIGPIDTSAIEAHENATNPHPQYALISALGTAAATDSSDYATAAQGGKADTALQSSDIGTTTGTVAAGDDARLLAVADKVDKVTGKGLSTEDYSTAEKSKLAGIATGATANATDAQLRDRTTHTGAQAISTVTGLQGALDALVPAATKGAANGVASLDAGGKVPESQLPAVVISDVFSVASQAAMLALTAERGDIAVRTDLNKTFALSAAPASTLGNWVELRSPTDVVQSVAGKTGVVTLVKADVGLGSVDNTPDASKPVSTAQAAAIVAATAIYTTEALGRAAVADGQAFKVQGSGDVAAYEYRRTNSTTSVLIATYPSSSAVVTKNSSNQVRNAYAPYVTWQHPDGDTEMDGNSNYAVIGSVGFYEQCTDATLLNVIQWRVWKTATLVDVEYRIYVRDTNAAFNLDSTARVASGTILAANMTNANAILKISLATPVQVPAGKYLFVLFKAVTDGYMGMQRWSTNTANRHGFLFNGVAGWNNSFSIGGSGYNSTAPKFFLESEELRTMHAVNTAAALSFNNALGGGFAATNVQAALQEIVSTDLVLPPSIFGVQGRECNVYFDNLLMDDASDYAISALAGLGVHQSERWTWTPAGAVTTGALTVGVYNKRTAGLISKKSTNYLAAASTAGTGLTKKVLVLGDSLVFAGVITQTLLDIAATDPMAVELYGTQGTGANKHEGHGGYTTASFVSTFSPFYDGSTINFANYLTVNSIPAPDWVFISLGINDMSGVFPDAAVLSAITNSMGYLNTLITSIKAAGAGIKVGLMIPTPPSNSQDAFGTNYGASQPERWRIKRSLVMYARQLLANYVGQEANRIYVVPVNTALDTVNNMVRYGATPANSRTSATIARQGNGVHPDTSGYQQMGDALWAFLKFYA